jgi:RNA polymerase sigma-70 factor (ECF subfamily)
MNTTAAATASGFGLLEDRWTETLDRLGAYIAARVSDRETAADITQNVLVRGIASGSLATADNPIAWLYRSAHNAVIDHYRTRRSHDHLDQHPEQPSEDGAEDNRPNAATRELARCLQPLILALEPIYRDAVTRVDLDGQTHQLAADELGITVSGMKSRVQRGRRQLKELLTGCCAVRVDHAGAVADYQHGRDTGSCSCR